MLEEAIGVGCRECAGAFGVGGEVILVMLRRGDGGAGRRLVLIGNGIVGRPGTSTAREAADEVARFNVTSAKG